MGKNIKNSLVIVFSFIFIFGFINDGISAEKSKKRYSPDDILVKFKPNVSSSSIEAGITKIHAALQIKKHFKNSNIYHLKIKDSAVSVEEGIERLENSSIIEYAEPNYIIVKASAIIPNDTSFNELWGMHNIGQRVAGVSGTLDADMDLPEAWDISTGSSDVVIALLDTGADYNHPDLRANIWNNTTELANDFDDDGNGKIDDIIGWNFVDNNNNPLDDDGHGTYIAGVIASKGNNSIGVTGVTWNSEIMLLKILDDTGYGTVSDVIAAIEYAISKGARIINASYTGSDYSYAEKQAIDAAANAGIILIAAAGNNGSNVDDNTVRVYPAEYNSPNIIAVAATDAHDILPSFSNYGRNTVDVAAPGVNIYTTASSAIDGSEYVYVTGTSIAVPHVSGLAALILSVRPNYSYIQIKNTILETVDRKPSLAGKLVSEGRANAYIALLASSQSSSSSSGGGSGGGCFIATAVYGSYLAPEVIILKEFRDKYLITNSAGRSLVEFYCRISPPIADYISRHPYLKAAIRFALTPLVFSFKYHYVFSISGIIFVLVYLSLQQRKRIRIT